MNNFFLVGIVVYVIWNFVGFIIIMMDKKQARRNERRIRERTFFLWALFLGAVGIIIGMYVFHHKTRHWSFVIGMPILCVFNLICGYSLWLKLG